MVRESRSQSLMGRFKCQRRRPNAEPPLPLPSIRRSTRREDPQEVLHGQNFRASSLPDGARRRSTYPSEKSACKRLRYVSHLFPITFPQEKHRTGMIIVRCCFMYTNNNTALRTAALHCVSSLAGMTTVSLWQFPSLRLENISWVGNEHNQQESKRYPTNVYGAHNLWIKVFS